MPGASPTNELTAHRDRLRELGVPDDRVYLDHGLTGTNRQRSGLDQALAAVRVGDTLVVPKLDRLVRSVPEARAIGDDLATPRHPTSLGGQVYDPTDAIGKMFFNLLAIFDEFEVDLLRMRTRGRHGRRPSQRPATRPLLIRTCRGNPLRSHNTWYLLPALPRSTGFGPPVSSPLRFARTLTESTTHVNAPDEPAVPGGGR